jgi:SAM-dependent methyltransferase
MSKPTGEINEQATSEDFEFAALQEAVNYRRSLLAEFSPHLRGKILEVGAGIGQITRELATLPNIESIDALEPDSRFYDKLLKQGINGRCICGTVADLEPVPIYDGIVCVNVLEHIDDHLDELKKMKQRLKQGGKLCLFVPACPSIYAPIDRSFGHYRRYTSSELRGLLEKTGFQVNQLCYYNSLGFFAWWMNFCVLKKTVFEVGKVKFYDKYLFPLVHALESRLMRPPFGQSLLAVAEA